MADLLTLQQRYVGLYDRIDEIEEMLATAKREKAGIEELLAEQMGLIGQNSTQIAGRRLTVRVTPRISRRDSITTEQLCVALETTEFAYLVKPGVNAQSLQAAMKEQIELAGDLPEEVRPLLRRWDQISVAVTKL